MYNKAGISLEIKITAAPSLVVRGNDGFLCLWSSYKTGLGKQSQFSTPGWFQMRFQAAPAEPEASCSDFATFFPAAASSLSVPVRISVISVSEQQQPSISTFNLDINIKKKVLVSIFLLFLKLCVPPAVVYFRILIPGAVFTGFYLHKKLECFLV